MDCYFTKDFSHFNWIKPFRLPCVALVSLFLLIWELLEFDNFFYQKKWGNFLSQMKENELEIIINF